MVFEINLKIFSQKQTNQIIPATIEKIKNSFITQVKKGLKWENKTSTIVRSIVAFVFELFTFSTPVNKSVFFYSRII